MDKIAEDLEDAARWNNSKTLYWRVNKLRGNSQSGLVPVKERNGATIVPVKERNGATISDKERVK